MRGDAVKMQWNKIILQLLVAAVVLFIFFYPFIFQGPSYDDLLSQCAASCQGKNKFGRLVERDGPYSPKPQSHQYDCVCQE